MEENPKFLFQAVQADETELPIAVADSAKELDELLGMPPGTTVRRVREATDGSRTGMRFYRITYAEDDTEDVVETSVGIAQTISIMKKNSQQM